MRWQQAMPPPREPVLMTGKGAARGTGSGPSCQAVDPPAAQPWLGTHPSPIQTTEVEVIEEDPSYVFNFPTPTDLGA